MLGAQSEGLLTGSQDGRVLAYSTTEPSAPPTTLLTFPDAACAATMHPTRQLLAVATGERRYPLPAAPASDDEPSDEEPGGADAACTNGLSIWVMPRSAQPTAQPAAGEEEPATVAVEGA